MMRVYRVAVLPLLLAAACGQGSVRLGDQTGPARLVLRVEVAGGFVPLELAERDTPEFSLYSDGRLVVPGAQIEIYPSPALPALSERTLAGAAVRRVQDRAREAGLEGPDRKYETQTISDAPTTTFTVISKDSMHTTSVYALDFEDPQANAEEKEARARLKKFFADLSDLGSWIPKEELGEERLFDASAARVFVHEYRAPEEANLKQQPRDWPLSQKPLATFGEMKDTGARCGAVTGEDADRVLDAATRANSLTPWRSDGKEFALVFRPLLPDESGC